ncbi:3-oxoacyl-[acyl-carrier-protein] synthase II [Stella humosa]|uniref:3-oxoacyl-[acyl-carrier-protein] synthase II n=1 Tax=Stella humosa TaxID=94 RepID=A0A3N1KRU3_9PROT|nr:beta-ketoacyl synthase N-terminal-like domain-containing protein [Stella humosa]ROP83311.1 3-oxoacyl-[acyl-carrier-protein] synthase II [Stella humosa]BBK29906.1 beta-ketoacyl-ACP synthase II [Stella humosa]
MTRSVAITGTGLVTSLARGVEANWTALLAGCSGIRRITRFPVEGLKVTFGGAVDHMGLDALPASGRCLAMGQAVAAEALAQAGLAGQSFAGPLVLALPPVEIEWPQRRRLAHLAALPTYAGMLAVADGGSESPAHVDFLFATVGDRLAEAFGTEGPPITLSTACASGATAIQTAVEAIRRGDCERALVIGSEGSLQVEALIRFGLLSALSTRNDDPAGAARPFAQDRDGFVMAEGAAALVLERADLADARGARPLAYVRGCGEAADTFHRTRSNPDGSAIVRAMAGAIADAGLTPDDIDHVNAHGTGTPENDKMECLAMELVFGARAGAVPVTANKSMIGHTLSAAGAIEAVVSVLSLDRQILPPTINRDTPDPAIALDIVSGAARPAAVRTVLSNSFGFGGQNVSLVLGLDPE